MPVPFVLHATTTATATERTRNIDGVTRKFLRLVVLLCVTVRNHHLLERQFCCNDNFRSFDPSTIPPVSESIIFFGVMMEKMEHFRGWTCTSCFLALPRFWNHFGMRYIVPCRGYEFSLPRGAPATEKIPYFGRFGMCYFQGNNRDGR